MAEDVLGALVVEGVGKAKSVADLFCGMGPFTLPAGRDAPECSPPTATRAAIAALQKALRFTAD